ncbi:hypothetical protein D3C72_536200 [compost metagenome]
MALQQAAGDLAHGDRIVHHHYQQRPPWRRAEHLAPGRTAARQARQAPLLATQLAQQVENQYHPAIAQQRCPRQPGNRGKLWPQALHHDLAAGRQAVGLDGERLLLGMHQQHRQRHALPEQCRARHALQQFTQVAQLVFVAGVHITRGVQLVARRQFGRRHADDALDGVQRNGVLLFAQVHHQRTVDRHGERQADQEARALALGRLDTHRAAQLLDLFVYHIHAQATPGNLGDLLGSGKARAQDELEDLVIAQLRLRVQQAALDGLAAHRFQWHAGTVVGHFDNDVRAFVQQIQVNGALLRLAGGQAHFAAFQAMVDGVAQHVLQRRHHTFEDAAVQFALGIAHHQLHLLAQFAGHLPYHTLQAWHQALEGHHQGRGQAFLQLAVHPRLLLQQAVGLLGALCQGFLEVEQVRGRLEQGPRQLLQLRVAVHFQRVEVVIGIAFELLPAGDSPLGLDVQAQQLVAHALEGGFHLVEGELRIVDLLLDAPTDDRVLTGQVAQVVEQLGIDLDHVARCPLRCHRRRLTGRGLDRPLAGGAVGQGREAEVADVVDQRSGGMQRLPQAHGIEHVRQAVMAVL